MTIETDCDNPRVVSLTNFNQFTIWLLFGASGGAKASLKKATHAGETRGHLFRWPFFMVSFFPAFFLHHPSANFAIANRLVRSVWLTC